MRLTRRSRRRGKTPDKNINNGTPDTTESNASQHMLNHGEIIAALNALPLPGDAIRLVPGLCEDDITAFTMLYRAYPDTLDLINRLVTTGCLASREKAASVLANTIWIMSSMVTRPISGGNLSWEEARDYMVGSNRALKQEDYLFRWSYLNVAHEVGMDDMPFAFHYKIVDALAELQPHTQLVRDAEAYWRGVSVLHFATDDEVELFSESIFRENIDFINWAGQHEDIATVIKLARERSTFDVETLEHLTTERQRHHAAISSGAL